MTQFKTNLLREKLEVYDLGDEEQPDPPVIALSNRMIVPLKDKAGREEERFIIRCQTMHNTARLAAFILQSYETHGAVMPRNHILNWENIWKNTLSKYDEKYNDNLWVTLYHKGQTLYESGVKNSLLDVVEKQDYEHKGAYEDAIVLTEEAVRQKGRNISITHDGRLALVLDLEDERGRCGVIVRTPEKTTSFNFTATHNTQKTINKANTLRVAAAFLEGMQLAFNVAIQQSKLEEGLIERFSDEEKQIKDGKKRLVEISDHISTYEKEYAVYYRPERPSFKAAMREAEQFARDVIIPKINGEVFIE